MSLASVGDNEVSLSDLKKSHAAEKSELERLLAAYEERLVDAERLIQKSEYNKDTLDELATRVDEAEAQLKTSKEHAGFLKDRASESRN